MLVYDRYILRQLILGMVMVTLGLIGVLWLTQSLRFIEITLNKGSSVWVFLKLTLLLMPGFLTIILPVSLFTVVLFTYNKLLGDRELIVLRAAGLSHWSLARPALYLAGGSVAISLLLNLLIIPRTVSEFRDMQTALRENVGGVVLQEGQFNQVGNGMTVYVSSRSPDGELNGVIIHDERNPQRSVTVLAERGVMSKADDGTMQVMLINGTRRQVNYGSERLSLLQFDTYALDFGSRRNKSGGERSRDARELSLQDLLTARADRLDPATLRLYRVEAHQRLSSPLYHIAFALMASACLLTGWFNRRGQSDRIVLAVGLLVLTEALALGANNIATKYLPLIPVLYALPLLVMAVSAWVLGRTPRRRRRPLPAEAA